MQETIVSAKKKSQYAKDFENFKQQFSNPYKYKFFLLTRLPMAFLAGLKITDIVPAQATVAVKYKWFNKNPFNSMYFAVLSMAAELSTGILVLGNIYKKQPTVSMLVLKTAGEFYKKATGTILFTCKDGQLVQDAVAEAMQTGESQTIACETEGINQEGQVVARFVFTWTIKARKES